ncbi:MAG: 30S ribosomal protein S16 [Candidatus Sungbacteria bacterium]|nr:30S ribosomal protein S16 [Candidatus Sungbacteria bacterium]
MLVIRLQRVGRKNDPAFRMVVGERRSKPQSNGMEVLGSYHPKTKETILKHERILYWMSKGSQVSDTAYNILVAKGVIRGKKRGVVPIVKVDNNTEKVESEV